MNQRQNDSIFEIFPLRFIRKVVDKFSLNSRWNMASCSKEFYKIICHNDKFKYRISLTDKLLDDYTIYDSIMGSKRTFDELYLRDVSLSAHNLKLLTDIAGRYGSTIKTLRMKFSEDFRFDGDLLAKNVQGFFVMLPNVTEWIFESSEDSRIFKNFIGAKPAFMKVKKFKFYGKQHLNIFSSFIASNTLEDVKFERDNQIESLLQRQCNLRSIENTFGGHHFNYLNPVAFKHLKLEEIKFPNIGSGVDLFMMSTISDHAGTLMKVDLFNCSLSGMAVEMICVHCVLLESFSLAVTNENVLNLLQIDRLKNLKEFGIHVTEEMTRFDILEHLTNKGLMSIEKIKLKFEVDSLRPEAIIEEEKDFYTRIGLNWQNGKELEVMPQYLALNDVIKSFRNLTIIKYETDMMSEIHRINGKVFQNVQELKLISPFLSHNDNFFLGTIYLSTHLLNAFPNITTLEVADSEFRGEDEFYDLFGLKHLKNLKIRFVVTSPHHSVDDNDVLIMKKLVNKLESCHMKFVGHIVCNVINQLDEKLRGALPFEVYEKEYGEVECNVLKIKINY